MKNQSERKRRILLISHDFFYTGAPNSLLNVAQVLLSDGANVEVLSLRDGPIRKRFEDLGIKVHCVNVDEVQKVYSVKKLLEFDLAIANTIVTAPVYAYVQQYIPTIWHIREGQNLPEFMHVPVADSCIRTSKDIVVVSEYAKDFVESTYKNNVKVVHNSVPDFYDDNCDKMKFKMPLEIMVVGAGIERKRFDLVIDAVKQLNAQGYQDKVNLNIIGVVSSGNNYGRYVLDSANTIENINYIGEIQDNDTKMDYYRRADIVVVPSMDESCSRVVLEALMMARPVIISENVGAKYAVDKSSGWVVETGKVEPITDILRDVIDGKYNMAEMSKCAREKYLETSSFDVFRENILNMVEEKIKEQRYKKLGAKKYKKESLNIRTWVKKLFSVANDDNRKHKIVTVFGMKIKIKIKEC